MDKRRFLKHREVFNKWLDGAEIQFYDTECNKWIDLKNPNWDIDLEYRIKPTKIDFIDCDFNEEEYSINEWGNISIIKPKNYKFEHRINFIKDRETAEAYAVLPQLIRLRDKYNEGWKPDYNDDNRHRLHIIYYFNNTIIKSYTHHVRHILAFKSSVIRDEFLGDYKDLIEIAKPLL